MKTFSSLKDEVKPKYESKDSLRNEIYSILENTLSIKISSEKSLDKDISINGREELVEKIKNLIDDVRIKERTFTLETVKANVHRNFDMRWLTEQIDGLKRVKTSSEFILTENIKDVQNIDKSDKTLIVDYFVKKLNENKKFGTFEFEYEPSDGIFKFINDTEGVIVKATPFYNDDNGFPIEVFDEKNDSEHIFIEQRAFNADEILFERYRELMEKFLIHDFDEWMNKVDKFDQKTQETDIENFER